MSFAVKNTFKFCSVVLIPFVEFICGLTRNNGAELSINNSLEFNKVEFCSPSNANACILIVWPLLKV